MAGHSKFKNIMHRKGAQDARRAKKFARLIKELQVAARSSTDPESNPRLRTALSACKSANMPKDNIQRVLNKANSGEQYNLEDIRYEGYGPGGSAIIVEALTTGGLTDWLWKSLAVCFKNVLKELVIFKFDYFNDNAISTE